MRIDNSSVVATSPSPNSDSPQRLLCYLPVEFLTVSTPTEIFGVRLLPLKDATIRSDVPLVRHERPTGCVASVDVTGVDPENAADHARTVAGHALRLLRTTLRGHVGINDWQLRFGLGEAYAFSDGSGGWDARPETANELELGPELVELALSQPMSLMPVSPGTNLERQADIGLRWMERARFAGEPIIAMLYLFFALESLLGDKSEGLKGGALAIRRAMLSHVVTGGFTDPGVTFFLYEKVRSAAIHGEDSPAVTWDMSQRLAWSVREALNEYLAYAQAGGFKRRSRLLQALNTHPDRPSLLKWLGEHGGGAWARYLDETTR